MFLKCKMMDWQIEKFIEYSLTELGLSLKPVIEAMKKWGEKI